MFISECLFFHNEQKSFGIHLFQARKSDALPFSIKLAILFGLQMGLISQPYRHYHFQTKTHK